MVNVKLRTPSAYEKDELVVHIRAGDVVDREWFLQRNYAEEIGRYGSVPHCNIATLLRVPRVYREAIGDFTEEKLQISISIAIASFEEILYKYSEINLILFQYEVDRDFLSGDCATFYLRRCRFSELFSGVRDYRNRPT